MRSESRYAVWLALALGLSGVISLSLLLSRDGGSRTGERATLEELGADEHPGGARSSLEAGAQEGRSLLPRADEPAAAHGGRVDADSPPSEGSSLSGRVLDAGTGQGIRAMLRATREGLLVRTEPTRNDGAFDILGLSPGIYALCATDMEGRAGIVERLEVATDRRVSDLAVELTPGATLVIRHEHPGLAHAAYVVRLGSAVVARGGMRQGVDFQMYTPVGSLDIVLHDATGRDSSELRRTLSVVAGERAVVLFD